MNRISPLMDLNQLLLYRAYTDDVIVEAFFVFKWITGSFNCYSPISNTKLLVLLYTYMQVYRKARSFFHDE